MPEIIEGIIKSDSKSLSKYDQIRKESDQFVKTYGKKYDIIPCEESDYKNFIQSEDLKIERFYRIRALRSFSDVKKGDIGGIMDDSSFLSHKGNCWIYDNAIVVNKSYVVDDAVVKDTSYVIESFVENNSRIVDDCYIRSSNISDSSIIMDDSIVDKSEIDGETEIKSFSYITNSICSGLHVKDHVNLDHCLTTTKMPISGIINLQNCQILVNASIKGFFSATNCIFTDNAEIDLDIDIDGYSSHIIGSNAKIHSDRDLLTIHGFGINRVPITFFKCSDNKIRCIINNDFSGDFSEIREYLLKNGGEEFDGEFDDIIKYVEKKLSFDEEK